MNLQGTDPSDGAAKFRSAPFDMGSGLVGRGWKVLLRDWGFGASAVPCFNLSGKVSASQQRA